VPTIATGRRFTKPNQTSSRLDMSHGSICLTVILAVSLAWSCDEDSASIVGDDSTLFFFTWLVIQLVFFFASMMVHFFHLVLSRSFFYQLIQSFLPIMRPSFALYCYPHCFSYSSFNPNSLHYSCRLEVVMLFSCCHLIQEGFSFL